jgi:hypothetical protein
MTSGQPDSLPLTRATKSAVQRRGLLAGIAAATAGLLAYTNARNTEVAYAVDGSFDNLALNGDITFQAASVNVFRDIHTSTNLGGMRFYNASTLTSTPDGAAIQFWGNGAGLPGQAFIDSGAHSSSAIVLRTAPTGGTITERMRINATGTTTFTGDVAITGMKQFVIDHPLDPDNQYLYHSVIEAPEQFNVYSGNVTTDANGNAGVSLPRYFEALNRDFRYQLTVIGNFAQATVSSKIQNNQFTIRTDQPNVEVSWQVMGIRNDAHAKANPFVAERPKKGEEIGTRIYPEDFNLPEDRGVRIRRGTPENVRPGPGTRSNGR